MYKYLLLFVFIASCEPEQEPPPAVPGGPVSWSHIAVGSDQGQIRVRGFDAAAPTGSTVEVSVAGASCGSVEADARGRFELRCGAGESVEIQVTGAGLEGIEKLSFAVHDMAAARAQAVNQRLTQTGAIPNHIVMPAAFAGAEDARLLLVNSGDGSVDSLSLADGTRAGDPCSLPPREIQGNSVPAQPFAVEALGELAAVTRFGHSGVSLFDIDSGAVIDSIDGQQAGPLPQPFNPPTPVDGDGDGSPEASVSALLPRSFEGLAAVGERLFVCAANLLQAGVPPIYGPGMVLIYDWDASSLRPAATDHLFTALLNPQVAVAAGELVAVVETGVLGLGAGGWEAQSDGGVELFDAATLEQVAVLNLGRSAPGSAVLSADGSALYVGSLLRPELYKIDLSARTVLRGPDSPIRLFESAEVQSIFSLVAHPMGLIFASSFNTDQVYAVDVVNEAVSPWPFSAPFAAGEGGQAFAGAHALALRPGRNGVDFRGADIAVLMSLAARLATIDTRHLMGP